MNTYPTPQDRLEGMLNWLESEGFFLYYNSNVKRWGLFNKEEDARNWHGDGYCLFGEDKYRIIAQALHDLAH